MEYQIRKATKDDCPEIIRLIQELADYEKMPDGPKINAETLAEDGFGSKSFYECFVASANEKLVGFVLYFYTYSTWEGRSVYMEDLYVTPTYRNKGIGKKLWQACVQAGLEMKCTRCNFSVLDWNKPSIEFYKSKGAVDLSGAEGWLAFRLHQSEMEKFVKEP